MKTATPFDMSSGTSKLEEAVTLFDDMLAKEERDKNYYHVVIVGEYNREVCVAVQREYIANGWSKAICKTSSENGERGGLTGLQLFV